MVALSVLSTILVISTVIMVQISKWYSKGVNTANLQNASRNITADVTSALQFSGIAPLANRTKDPVCQPAPVGCAKVYAYCLGNIRYSYILDRKLGTDEGTSPAVPTEHVLWRDTMKTSANCNPLNITVPGTPRDADTNTDIGGYEMAAANMRLMRFDLSETPAGSGIYTLVLNMAYGDGDLVVNNGGKAGCKGGQGTEFCAASNNQTSISRRLK